MRAAPLGPSVELLWGHETCEACAGIRGADACARRHWAIRWSSHGAVGRPDMGGADACGRRRWGRWLGSYGATKRVRGVPKWVARTHAGGTAWAFGGSPMGPRGVRGVCRHGWRGRTRAAPSWPSVELLCGHETCEGYAEMGGADACGLRRLDLRWSSYWVTQRFWGVSEWVARTHAGCAWTFGGAPMGPRNV